MNAWENMGMLMYENTSQIYLTTYSSWHSLNIKYICWPYIQKTWKDEGSKEPMEKPFTLKRIKQKTKA